MRNHYGYGYCPRCNRIFPKISNTQRVCSEKCRKELTNKNHHRLYYKDLPKMQKYKREQERERRKNPELVKRRKDARLKLRQKVIELLGKSCVLCGSEYKVDYHEIHGKKHTCWNQYFIDHYKDFVPLCRKHHIALHRLEESKNPELAVKLLITLIEHGDSTQNFISHANIIVNQLMKYEQPNKDHEQIGHR